MVRRALEKLGALLNAKLVEPRLCAAFGLFFSPLIVFVLLACVAAGALGLLMWLAGISWGPEILMSAMAVAGVSCMLGVVMIGLLMVADVGVSGVLVARDAVRAVQTVRRQQARPEAGQLTFPEREAEGGLSAPNAEAGAVSLPEPSADTLV